MKNLLKTALLVMLITTLLPSTSNALSTDLMTAAGTEKTVPAQVQKLINRLEEIKLMDKKDMSRKEKKELRTEVKSIQREMHEHGHGGAYISVGGAIIIILLLIILL